MTCEQFRDEVELYALGALEGESASALAEHVATGCTSCQEALSRALEQNRLISSSVPLVDPPSRLRRRVREAIAPTPKPKWQWLPWAAAAAALIALTIGLATQLRSRAAEHSNQARLSKVLEILGSPDTRKIPFTDPNRPELHGSVYVHPRLGAALVIDRLAEAPIDQTYESWVVPASGTPQPVEPFLPDASGRAVSLIPGPIDPTQVGAVAVSIEPVNSQPSKPTTVVFAAKIPS